MAWHEWQYLPPEVPAWLLKKEAFPCSVTLSSLLSVKYIAPVRGEKRERNHTKLVQEPLSAVWILRMDMEEALVYIFRSDNGQKKQNAKKGSIHAPLGKTKGDIVACAVSENCLPSK